LGDGTPLSPIAYRPTILEQPMPTTRRGFLAHGAAGLSFVSLGGSMPGLFARAAEASMLADKNDHVLVVVELAGGNDGLNTVVPFEDALYYKNRRRLGLPKGEVQKLNELIGLHPKMGPMAELFKSGELAIVQGVGYPKPDRSHFRSMEIWHTASLDASPPTSGWLGRSLDATEPAGPDQPPRGMSLTGSLPQAFQAEKVVVPVVAQLDAFNEEAGANAEAAKLRRRLTTSPETTGVLGFLRRQSETVYKAADRLKAATEKYKSEVEYPGGELGEQLKRAAQIIAGRIGVRVLFASQDGYDTHANQLETHANLLEQLSSAFAAFRKDLAAQGVADQVVVMVFSEFGRRVDENASAGTDHGAASNVFLVGSKVQGGLVGKYPSLAELGEGDLIYNTDFRSVYATLLDRWLGCPAEKALGKSFPTLPLIRG
jgi:uncharacterized protein (DUF1501 family)